MSCTNPNYALDLGMVDGKRKIKFLPKRYDLSSIHQLEARYGKEYILTLPCGQCTSCRLQYARQWAVRCVLEASLHERNYFATLTYRDDCLPNDRSAAQRDVQLFFKRLRKAGYSFRYFGCCERGDTTNRLHHHVLFFGLDLSDVRPLAKGKYGGYWYKSIELEKLWNKGIVDLGDVEFGSASYVARYSMKKQGTKDPDEFIYMSTRPAIGKGWFDKHKDTIQQYDQIFCNFGKFNQASLPRYFDKLLELCDPDVFAQIKAKRLENSRIAQLDDLIHNDLEYREEIYKMRDEQINKKVKRLKRGL